MKQTENGNKTLCCGLLGEKLGHSYSPGIHRLLADYEYRLYERTSEELDSFLLKGKWDGLNVTIPYKKRVVPYCAELSEAAARVGSVNTLVKDPSENIFGDNTDVYGFSCLLKRLGVDPAGKKALILGNGGASVSVRYVLENAGTETVVISRSGENNYTNLDRHKDAALLVNTTPVGMYPENGKQAVSLACFPALEGVLDIIYNPFRTALLLQAEEAGIPFASGLYMLTAQAVKSSRLFLHGKDCQDSDEKDMAQQIDAITQILAHSMQNLILVGMPGCGKSSVSKVLAKKTGRELLELDQMFETIHGISPAQCILQEGEAVFREKETQVIREAGKLSGMILSTGGGCVTIPENYPLLHQNGVIVWLEREIGELEQKGRPLSERESLAAMYERRRPCYERFADLRVVNDGSLDEVAGKILSLYEKRRFLG